MPVIFDLPTPLAIKRTNEFFRYVHPVLQHYCAKCHDGHYDGPPFQLVPIASRGDKTPEAMWSNLDAGLAAHRPRESVEERVAHEHPCSHGRGARLTSIFPGLERPDLSDPGDLGPEPAQSQAR